MASRLRFILSMAFLVWTAFVLAAFYAVQKPISAQDILGMTEGLGGFAGDPSIAALAGPVLDLLTATAIGFAALICGARVMPLPYPGVIAPLRMRAEYWLLSTGLGFGLIGGAMLMLALVGVLSPLVMAILGALLLLIAPGTIRSRLAHDLREMTSIELPRPLRLFIVLSLGLALLTALAPPTAWDGLVYHLTVPQRALLAGRLSPLGDITPQENFPLLMSSLYLLAMLMRGDIAAQCLHFLYGVMTLGLIALATRQFYSRAAVPATLAIALSMPMLLLLASWAYNDVALAFYTLAALYTYRRWHEERMNGFPLPQGSPAGANPRSAQGFVVIAGLMAGFALGLKYTSFLLPLGILAFLLFDARPGRARPVIVFALSCAAAAAPWYLKNWWFTGNPVYPFVFGGAQWDDLRAVWYAHAGSGTGLDLIALLTMPVVTTQGYRDANFIDGRIGPLILLLLPLLLLRRSRFDSFLALFLIFYGAWVAGVVSSSSLWQSRLLLPALVLAAPPLAQAFTQLKEFEGPSFSLYRITKIVVAVVLGLAAVSQTVAFVQVNPVAYLLGAETREHFLVRQTGAHAAAMEAVRQLPASARVQFLWEPRSYLAERPVRADPLLDALPHLVATTGSVEASARRLKSEGFTHVLVWEAGAKFANDNLRDSFGERDAQDLRQLESEYARVVYENAAYRLLELK
jgi:hypothetical protein